MKELAGFSITLFGYSRRAVLRRINSMKAEYRKNLNRKNSELLHQQQQNADLQAELDRMNARLQGAQNSRQALFAEVWSALITAKRDISTAMSEVSGSVDRERQELEDLRLKFATMDAELTRLTSLYDGNFDEGE